MNGMTGKEIIQLIKNYIGVSDGDLQDFSHRTLQEFYQEYCDLDIDARQYPGTKRERFEAILRASSPAAQSRIIPGRTSEMPASGGPRPADASCA